VVDVRFCDAGEDGVLMVSGCHDKLPMLRWGDNGDWIGTFDGHKGAVWSSCLNSDASKVATGSGDFSARIWDAVTGLMLFEMEHNHIVKTVEFSKNDKYLLTGGHEKILRIFDLGSAKIIPVTSITAPASIRKASWLSDSLVICGCDDGSVQIWDVTDHSEGPKKEWTLKHAVKDLEFCEKLATVTVASGNSVYFYDSASLELKKKVDLSIKVEGASLNPVNSKEFVAGGNDLWVHVVDYESEQELHCHKGHHGPIFCLRYAPDGNSYASGSEDGTIRIWSHTNKEVVTEELLELQ